MRGRGYSRGMTKIFLFLRAFDCQTTVFNEAARSLKYKILFGQKTSLSSTSHQLGITNGLVPLLSFSRNYFTSAVNMRVIPAICPRNKIAHDEKCHLFEFVTHYSQITLALRRYRTKHAVETFLCVDQTMQCDHSLESY